MKRMLYLARALRGVYDPANDIWLLTKKKLHGLSPRANYTDRATSACRRSDCQLVGIEGAHVVSVTVLSGRILGFLDRGR
jgi:hypothetical protein